MRPETSIGDDSKFLANLADGLQSRLDKGEIEPAHIDSTLLMVARFREVSFKIRQFELILSAQWIGAIADLVKFQNLVGELKFCTINPRCYKPDGHKGECKPYRRV